MGSDSDLPFMEPAAEVLAEMGVPAELRIISAYRTPDDMLAYARGAIARQLEVLIAGAGGAAHLPGMISSATVLPVIGVPVPLKDLKGIDSLLSIVQMPAGVPVATVAIGSGRNAGLLAARILAVSDPKIRTRLITYQGELAEQTKDKDAALQRNLLVGQ